VSYASRVPLYSICRALALVLTLPMAVFGCSTSSGTSAPVEAGAGIGSPCDTPDDCPPPTLCAWPVDGGCAAQGLCVKEDLTCVDQGATVLCACDDSPVTLSCIYGAGHAPQPLPSPARMCMGPPEAGAD
jgi:hypothetical protein